MTDQSWVNVSHQNNPTIQSHEWLHLRLAEIWGRYATNELRRQTRDGELVGVGKDRSTARKDLVAKTEKEFRRIERRYSRLQEHRGGRYQSQWETQMKNFVKLEGANNQTLESPGVDPDYIPPQNPNPLYAPPPKELYEYPANGFAIIKVTDVPTP